MKTVSIKICLDVEGEFIKSVLVENGIRVVVVPYQESALTAISGSIGMVEVLVNEPDAQRALDLLDNTTWDEDLPEME